jgi:hypothetical protein
LKTRLIKCDVEGYELFVFRGADRVLSNARPFVILEIGLFETQGYTPADVYEFFRSRSYLPYALVDGNRLAPIGEGLDHAGALSVNRIFVPSEHAGALQSWLATDGNPGAQPSRGSAG